MISKVAERYAKSLFELALERKEAEAVYSDILQLRTGLQGEARIFALFLKSPVVHSGQKAYHHQGTFRNNISEYSPSTFISILVRKNREALIPEIAGSFIEQYKDHNNILTVHVQITLSTQRRTTGNRCWRS